MKHKKLYLQLFIFLAITIIIFLFIFNKHAHISPNGNIIVKIERDSKKLIYLDIFDKKRKITTRKYTHSSIYQKYKIIFLGNDSFLFQSSDTGSALFKYNGNYWVGLNIYNFFFSSDDLLLILLSTNEKKKLNDVPEIRGEDIKDYRLSVDDEYELLIYRDGNLLPSRDFGLFRFSMNFPPWKAIEKVKPNEFILKEKNRTNYFTIDSTNVLCDKSLSH